MPLRFSFADRSKARHRLRSKISAEKNELTKLVSEYNKLPSTVCPANLEDVLQHKFPWEFPDDNNARMCLKNYHAFTV